MSARAHNESARFQFQFRESRVIESEGVVNARMTHVSKKASERIVADDELGGNERVEGGKGRRMEMVSATDLRDLRNF